MILFRYFYNEIEKKKRLHENELSHTKVRAGDNIAKIKIADKIRLCDLLFSPRLWKSVVAI
jgi:hypothetical protein